MPKPTLDTTYSQLRCEIASRAEASFGRGWALSDGKRQLVEGGTKKVACRVIPGDLVVTTP